VSAFAKLCMLRVKAVRGECYKNCVVFTMANMFGPHEWTVCHGVVTGQLDIAGQRIGHAWMEITLDGRELVYEPAHHVIIDKANYYEHAKPAHVVRYNCTELLSKAIRENSFGPWDENVAAALHRDPDDEESDATRL
jgi:hypothetical protein